MTSVYQATHERIKQLLPRTWHAFFARFRRLREVQVAAIPPIVAGHDVLVGAPTAAGKTEAIVAPILERVLSRKPRLTRGPFVLLVAPTRALCNDLERRLHIAIETTGLILDIKTGDDPSFNENKPPDVLITTPESFDSMLSRQPKNLRQIKAIVIDEIHLLAQNGRGDALACLIQRLLRIIDGKVQICAASATLSYNDEICRKFLGDGAKIVETEQDVRPIHHDIVIHMLEHEHATTIAELTLETATRKVLVFCNARREVERYVDLLLQKPELAGKVFAHHGSLSKSERLRTEKHFLRSQNAVCVATSTLELGIDIGDVDHTVLIGPPPNVSALVQRIGRGNRKQNTLEVTCLGESTMDAQRFEHLLGCARQGKLLQDRVAFRPTTIVQQAFSLTYQNPKRWVSPAVIHDRLPAQIREIYSREDILGILYTLEQRGLYRMLSKQRFQPEPKLDRLYKYGKIHAMLEDLHETDVIDATTGRKIGSVAVSKNKKQALQKGLRPTLSLAGRKHAVSAYKDEALFVRHSNEMGQVAFESRDPPRYSLELAQDFKKFLRIPDEHIPIHVIPNGLCFIQHYLGSIGGYLLASVLKTRLPSAKISHIKALHMFISTLPSDEPLPPEEELMPILQNALIQHQRNFARVLQIGPYAQHVPIHLISKWLTQSIPIEKYAKAIANRQFFIHNDMP